jgi:potassium-transporting ATPase ATP-binding subunit
VVPAGLAGLANSGPHGFSELLYAYSSVTGNNGSAFAGLSGNTSFFNLTLAGGMMIGRFAVMVPVLAIAGSLAAKKLVPASAGTFPTDTGTQAAREAGNMVDLDSDPTKLIEIVLIGKQLLITRGALTTFSIANDVAKYFAIIPAMFAAFYPSLGVVNIMGLQTPQSAILSAVVFNALIIIALIPLALRGVKYRPQSAGNLLFRNLLIYGVGGVIVPFIGIKAIDVLINQIGII